MWEVGTVSLNLVRVAGASNGVLVRVFPGHRLAPLVRYLALGGGWLLSGWERCRLMREVVEWLFWRLMWRW